MSATPDRVLRSLGDSLPQHMATEQQIRNAFSMAGYGPKKIDKWWNYYRNGTVGIILACTKDGRFMTNEDGKILYTTPFWM